MPSGSPRHKPFEALSGLGTGQRVAESIPTGLKCLKLDLSSSKYLCFSASWDAPVPGLCALWKLAGPFGREHRPCELLAARQAMPHSFRSSSRTLQVLGGRAALDLQERAKTKVRTVLSMDHVDWPQTPAAGPGRATWPCPGCPVAAEV